MLPLGLRAIVRRQILPLLRRSNATLTQGPKGAAASAIPPPSPATSPTAKPNLTPKPRTTLQPSTASTSTAKPASNPGKSSGPKKRGSAAQGTRGRLGRRTATLRGKKAASKTGVKGVRAASKAKAGAAGEKTRGRGRRRKRKLVKKRPKISLRNPRTWCRPLKEGVLPVYDEALKLIREDSTRLKRECAGVLAQIQDLEKKADKSEQEEAELDELKKKAQILEVQSDINRPSVRWSVANGMADLTKLSHRHLVEQRWRNYGTLDLLMERIHQMNVVPDLLPSLHPSIDLRLTFPEPPPKSEYLRSRTTRRYRDVIPGIYLRPTQTRRPPRLYTSVFHTDTRFYTLLLVDADVPDPENQTYTTFLHWLQPNIPLSASAPSRIRPYPHTGYIPPHPQRGSPYHRYCLFLLPHVNPTERISVPAISDEQRRGFDLREFCATHGLDGSLGGAAHMWREEWDETVSEIYKHTLKLPEPRYGLPPRPDPYAEVKGLKRFAK